jgi:hypothetical protein
MVPTGSGDPLGELVAGTFESWQLISINNTMKEP